MSTEPSRYGFVVYQQRTEKQMAEGMSPIDTIYDVREYDHMHKHASPQYPSVLLDLVKDITHALKHTSDDVMFYVSNVDWFGSPKFEATAFMGFAQGRRKAVPCICVDLQTVALEDLAAMGEP